MKEINGTITLAYVEEDNKQRVIFRVIPLCTREGCTLHGGAEDFPDEGSLRIVPDKREQSTFKERMREIGGLCAIALLSDGKELLKVRQNRNYAPDQGEKNQFAIYSDVICEFAEDGCFEVVELGASTSDALTERVLLHKDKILYGPVEKEEAQKASVERLKPFGNDRFLLHTIQIPALGKHIIYWDPEATLNWRQRRNTLRKRERTAAEEQENLVASDEAGASHSETVAAVEVAAHVVNASMASASIGDRTVSDKAGASESDSAAVTKTLDKATTNVGADVFDKTAVAAGTAASDKTIALASADPCDKPALPFALREKHPETPATVMKDRAAKQQLAAKDVNKQDQMDKPVWVDPHTRRVERAAAILEQEEADEQAQQKAQFNKHMALPEKFKEQESALPIGTHLDILDNEMPFEQQISRLAQPLSEHANRLIGDLAETAEEPQEAIARFFGTPLVQATGRITRTTPYADPVHHVVEQQMRHQRDEVMGAEIGSSAYGIIDNPIENLQSSVDYVWQNVDMRQQAIAMLMRNESFTSDLLNAFRRAGMNMQASVAAQEQLADIEAERLSLLMQLENAKTDEKKYRENAIASLSQKKRDESERLKRDVAELEKTKKKLGESMAILSNGTAEQVIEFLAVRMNCLSGAGEQRVLLAPVLGKSYQQQELCEKLRIHMNDSGFSLKDDEATALLINFALFDTICFRAASIADAQLFTSVLLESFGLQSVSAMICPGAYVEMISLLPEDMRRTPTVTVQPLGTETMSVFGHKTLFLTDESVAQVENEALYPIIKVPAMQKVTYIRTAEWEPLEPAALATFVDIRKGAVPLLEEAEKWFSGLKNGLFQVEISMPDAKLASMRSFIEVATGKVRGGFLAAADTAVCHWVIPMLSINKSEKAKLVSILAGLPHALESLEIQ